VVPFQYPRSQASKERFRRSTRPLLVLYHYNP